MVQESSESRVRQILAVAVLLLLITLVVCGSLIGWRHVPGLTGEWMGMMIGMMTTPFLMEASFVILGFCVVFWLNHRRQMREGGEWVVLERVDVPQLEGKLPDHARWVVLPDASPPGEEPGWLDQAEGAADAGDWEELVALLERLDSEELRKPQVLRLRERLAMATGHQDLARELAAGREAAEAGGKAESK